MYIYINLDVSVHLVGLFKYIVFIVLFYTQVHIFVSWPDDDRSIVLKIVAI